MTLSETCDNLAEALEHPDVSLLPFEPTVLLGDYIRALVELGECKAQGVRGQAKRQDITGEQFTTMLAKLKRFEGLKKRAEEVVGG